MGPKVDPLGEVLMKLLPDGLRALLAPAVIPPALVFVEAPAPALPLRPVAAPRDAAVPEVVAPVAPPLCASANVLVSAKTAARANVANFITISLSG